MIKGSGYSRLILRGESDENLYRQFYADTTTPIVLAYLFMTDEKARYCWNNNMLVRYIRRKLQENLLIVVSCYHPKDLLFKL